MLEREPYIVSNDGKRKALSSYAHHIHALREMVATNARVYGPETVRSKLQDLGVIKRSEFITTIVRSYLETAGAKQAGGLD